MLDMDSFVNFWNSLGWVANLIEIVSCVFVLSLFIKRLAKKRSSINSFKYKNLSELVREFVPNKNNIKLYAIKNSKLAIVDDNPADFPLEFLRKTGFSIEVIDKVSLSEYEIFSKYDLVMLDISGVVTEDLNEGGLELIKRINSLNDRPKIVAVSSKKFDPRASEFFSIADDVMSKPVRERECEEAITSLLLQKYSPYCASEYIDQLISNSSIENNKVIKLYKILFKYVYDDVDRLATKSILQKYYAFMNFEKTLSGLDVIKKFTMEER